MGARAILSGALSRRIPVGANALHLLEHVLQGRITEIVEELEWAHKIARSGHGTLPLPAWGLLWWMDGQPSPSQSAPFPIIPFKSRLI